MPYLKPKMDEDERTALLRLFMEYADTRYRQLSDASPVPASEEAGAVFLKALNFIDGLMADAYRFGKEGSD